MPGLDGLELQRRLAEEGNALPIVFVTGHGDIPMSVRAMKAGAKDFLTKPVQSQVLVAAIRAAIEQDAAARRARGRHRSHPGAARQPDAARARGARGAGGGQAQQADRRRTWAWSSRRSSSIGRGSWSGCRRAPSRSSCTSRRDSASEPRRRRDSPRSRRIVPDGALNQSPVPVRPRKAVTSRGGQYRRYIAVVDDEAVGSHHARPPVALADYEVAAFGCGDEFLHPSRRGAPTALILDIHMPGLSGLDMKARLADARIAIPVVFITASDDVALDRW